MEELLISLEKDIMDTLSEFLNVINVITGGIAILASSCITIWAIYRAYLILAGMEAGSFIPIFKDLFIKMIIIVGVATAPAYYKEVVPDLLINTTNDLGMQLSGKKDQSVFSNVGQVLDRSIEGLTIASTAPESTEAEKDASWISKGWAWLRNKVSGFVDAINVFGWLDAFSTFLKFMIISAGALYLATVSFLTVLTSKIFAYISLAIGPLFVFFAAFNVTRNWFFSWLATTLGYLFNFTTVMLVWGVLLKIFSNMFYINNTNDPMNWFIVGKSFVACYFFAKIIGKIGDLSGQWFSAGNITDGVNSLVYGQFGSLRGRGPNARMPKIRIPWRGRKGSSISENQQ